MLPNPYARTGGFALLPLILTNREQNQLSEGSKMFQETKRDGKGWRFDWINDRGDVFKGLRFYPETGVLSTWSRKPHKMARDKFHPYRINDNDWAYIKLACIARWKENLVLPLVKEVPVEWEVEVSSGIWRSEEWCQRVARTSLRNYAERNKCQIRQKKG